MEIHSFPKNNERLIREAAELLEETFPHSYRGRGVESIQECLGDDSIALIACERDRLIGFIGAQPQYGRTGWELHPLMVQKAYWRRGIGTALIAALEQCVASQGGVTLYLGTDDEFAATSLSGTDLYEDTYAKIERIANLGDHPYEFYQKRGYTIVGVIPDANGTGKPDIIMAKRVGS